MRLKTDLPAEALAPLEAAAAALGCEAAILAAILHRESGHLRGAARLSARRFEPHVFRRLGGGLAASHAGAAKIDPELAEAASSHGAPQIMGHHARMLGYASAQAMRAAFVEGGWPEQIRALRLYAEKSGMASPLRAPAMAEIARIYNGPAYAKNAYDTRLAADYARISGAAPARVLRIGAQGEEVAALQQALTAAGYEAPADGVFGPRTAAAVSAFQQAQGLLADGVVGAKTWEALGKTGAPEASAPPPGSMEIELDRLWRHRGKLSAAAAALAAARDEVAALLAALGLDPAAAADRLSAALMGIPPERLLLAAVLALLLWREASPRRGGAK